MKLYNKNLIIIMSLIYSFTTFGMKYMFKKKCTKNKETINKINKELEKKQKIKEKKKKSKYIYKSIKYSQVSGSLRKRSSDINIYISYNNNMLTIKNYNNNQEKKVKVRYIQDVEISPNNKYILINKEDNDVKKYYHLSVIKVENFKKILTVHNFRYGKIIGLNHKYRRDFILHDDIFKIPLDDEDEPFIIFDLKNRKKIEVKKDQDSDSDYEEEDSDKMDIS